MALMPVFGEPFLCHWMRELAARGVDEARVVTSDAPEPLAEALGNGSRWGLRVEVRPEVRELSAAEARQRHRGAGEEGWPEPPLDVIEADHLPGLPEHKLFADYRSFAQGLGLWLPRLAESKRIGLREIEPGVWMGRRTHLAAGAVLKAPCWIGNHVRIGRDAVVGPNSFVEDGVVLDRNSEVAGSWVGPGTFVGVLTQVKDSLAWGSVLASWRTGSHTVVPDRFLLSSLSEGPRHELAPRSKARLVSAGMTRPFAPVVSLAQKLQG